MRIENRTPKTPFMNKKDSSMMPVPVLLEVYYRCYQ